MASSSVCLLASLVDKANLVNFMIERSIGIEVLVWLRDTSRHCRTYPRSKILSFRTLLGERHHACWRSEVCHHAKTLFFEPKALADLQNRLVGNRLAPQAQFRLYYKAKHKIVCL